MIDPKELRIGNIIKDDRKAKEWRFVTHRIISDLASNPSVGLYHAVDLTEEWLIKFGFGPSDEHELGHNINPVFGFYYDYHFKRFRLDAGEDDHIPMRHIHHVHQLQNLYFALTGEELTIKE